MANLRSINLAPRSCGQDHERVSTHRLHVFDVCWLNGGYDFLVFSETLRGLVRTGHCCFTISGLLTRLPQCITDLITLPALNNYYCYGKIKGPKTGHIMREGNVTHGNSKRISPVAVVGGL